MKRTIKVFVGDAASWVGTMHYDAVGSRERSAFEYAGTWLAASRRTGDGATLWIVRQGQDLVERFLVGDQVGLDQLLAGGRQGHRIQVQMPADGRIGVVTQPLDVGDGDQEQIQRPGTMVGAGKIIVADQPMVHPTETWGNVAQPFRPQQMLVDHNSVGQSLSCFRAHQAQNVPPSK